MTGGSIESGFALMIICLIATNTAPNLTQKMCFIIGAALWMAITIVRMWKEFGL